MCKELRLEEGTDRASELSARPGDCLARKSLSRLLRQPRSAAQAVDC